MKSPSSCTIIESNVLSDEELDKLNDVDKELSDEELENVIGGQSPSAFDHWRCELLNELKIKVNGK
jgi:bacteriocin-like protein